MATEVGLCLDLRRVRPNRPWWQDTTLNSPPGPAQILENGLHIPSEPSWLHCSAFLWYTHLCAHEGDTPESVRSFSLCTFCTPILILQTQVGSTFLPSQELGSSVGSPSHCCPHGSSSVPQWSPTRKPGFKAAACRYHRHHKPSLVSFHKYCFPQIKTLFSLPILFSYFSWAIASYLVSLTPEGKPPVSCQESYFL